MMLPLTSWINVVSVWVVLHSLPIQITRIDWNPPCWDEECPV